MNKEATDIISQWASGKIEKVPPHMLNENYLFCHDGRGLSLFHIAAKCGQIKDIPSYLLSKENLLKEDIYGRTIMVCIAESGSFEAVPQDYVTEQTLTAHGEPPVIHALAMRNELHKIPKVLINQTTIMCRNKNQDTTLLVTAREGDLSQIPRELLTDDNLLAENKELRTPLIEIYINQDPSLLPKKYTTEERLMHKRHTQRLIDLVVLQCQIKNEFSILRKLIKNFSDESLEILEKEHSDTAKEFFQDIMKQRDITKKILDNTKSEQNIEM